MVLRFSSRQSGFTLMEMVAAVAIFGILAAGVIGLLGILVKSAKAAREQVVLANLASSYLEKVRNLSYDSVGTINGNPVGPLADETSPITQTIQSINYKIYYEVTYIDDPADGTILAVTDAAPNDYKQVKMYVENTSTNKITSFVTNVSPKGIEEANSGAIYVHVIDSYGQPVSNASVHIQNSAGTLILDRLSDSTGAWVEVGLTAGVNEYHLSATKNGYSTDQTYPITAQNPNPTKPDLTVVNGQVTNVTFTIDQASNLTIRTLNEFCAPEPGVNVNIHGAKLIGTNPNVYKFNGNYTSNGSGLINLNNIEWDVYTPTLVGGQNLMVLGTSPIQQINVLPGSSATYTMILDTQTTNSFLVIVKDAGTGTALEGATVNLHKGGSTPQDYTGTTGGNIWVQNSWTGGSGQQAFVDYSRYFSDDGNVDSNSNPTGLKLNKISGRYVASGVLESSTFDTGAPANLTTITWQPTSQNPATQLKFQIATNSDNATWNFKGPDGTAGTYYTVPGTNIASIHDGDRYVRYRVYESTTDDKYTPVLTGFAINYVSGCFTPGQISFTGLTAGNNYDLTVSLPGYADETINNISIFGNQLIEVLMTPP
jgi:prepilin-type N-terminal cleavage/methylation domain-containing protein